MIDNLFLISKGVRPDLQESVAFRMTRVKGTRMNELKKLGWVIRYLSGDLETPLTFETDNTHVIKWWVDASFDVH